LLGFGKTIACHPSAAHGLAMLGLALVVCFASWLTVHLSIVVGLFAEPPRWRAAVCLLPPLVPLALAWALRQGMYRRAILWGASGLGYLALLYAAYR
jgi:uncharacterized membrane protein YhdT